MNIVAEASRFSAEAERLSQDVTAIVAQIFMRMEDMNRVTAWGSGTAWIVLALLAAGLTSSADETEQRQRSRRVLYNFDGDSCLSTKAGGKRPVPVHTDDVKRLIEEVAYAGSCVDTVLVCINAQVMYYPTKVGTMRGTLSTPAERGLWPASEKQRFENLKAFFDAGVDPYAIMLAEAKRRGREALLTFRMNDDHGNDFLRTQFLVDHPDWRLGTEQYRGKGAMDFGREEVRDYTFQLIEEAVRRYDSDGIELDFNRFPTFFKDGSTDERIAKMNSLMERVHRMLDEVGRERGRRLLLAVRPPSNYGRTPPTPESARELGCDVPDWVKSGWVDFVSVSEFLHERGDLPIAVWKQAIPAVPVYGGIECTKAGEPKNLTADEYRDAATQLIKAGADGTYLFNFFTSREGGENAYEPPFEVLRELGPLSVGLRKQLFVDDFIVAEKHQVMRELGHVTKANDGKPIFTDGWFYGTVLHDEGRFKLWFRKPGTTGFGYAESTDGLVFTRHADLEGINFAGDYTLAVEIDSAETDEQHRFKAGYDAPGMAAGIAHSADGIRWTPYNDGKPVTQRAADTYNQILRDPEAHMYRLFTRSDFGTAGGSTELRGTRSMINTAPKTNPENWTLVREWIFDKEGTSEAHRRQIYAATCWIRHGVYFALLSVYDFPGDVSEGTVTDTHQRHERDVMNFYIATSRDGDSWDMHWVYEGQPLVPRGPDGAFDKDIILPASTIVTHADQHWIYYAGANERHGNEQVRFDRKHAIGLATMRLDGFVGLSAGAIEGTVVTRPFRLEGDRLLVNVDAANGEVWVDVLDETGQPLAGYSAEEAVSVRELDELRWPPRWKQHTDLSGLRGRIVQLKFHLTDATLYAFQIHDRSVDGNGLSGEKPL